MKAIKDIIKDKAKKQGAPRARHEFQEYGIRLSEQLHDHKHKALYIKLAKEKSRPMLESARIFATDFDTQSLNRGRLFMWKLAELEKDSKNKK